MKSKINWSSYTMNANIPIKTDRAPIAFDTNTCRFNSEGITNAEIQNLEHSLDAPLSVILQITRRCHFNCVFCSEKNDITDPSLKALEIMAKNLNGTKRVFLSGGEPFIRNDFPEIIDIFCGKHIIGVPTNAVASEKVMHSIKGKIDFVNIGLDGPRNITSRVRGDYDSIMEGVWQFKKFDIPLSLTGVVLRGTADSVLYTCQIADVLGAKKVKFVLPIPKGNALNLPKEEYLTHEECIPIFDKILEEKEKNGWKPKITFTTWGKKTEGYSLLVYPNGHTFAWPVYDQPDKVLFLGDLSKESIKVIWSRYPFKLNHLRKYIGKGVFVG